MSDHAESAPPSQPPEPQHRERMATNPNGAASSGQWSPLGDDMSPVAVTWRRTERNGEIARAVRKALGYAPLTRPDGTKDLGDGVLGWQARIEAKVDAVFALLQEGQAKRKGLVGWLAARGDRLADVLLPLIVLALAAALSGHVALK